MKNFQKFSKGSKKINVLFENGINDGEPILFINTKTLEPLRKEQERGKKKEQEEKKDEQGEKKEEKEEKKEESSGLNEEEKEIIQKFLDEFIYKKYMEFLQEILFLKEGEEEPKFSIKISIDEFHEFLKKKIEELGINPDEHEHKIVYCLTNFDWECNECKEKHFKKEGRYFCSQCEYNMCDKCIEKKDYYKMKPFPNDITPSNKNVKENKIKSKHHEHQLVYCRTKRTCLSCGWICDVCKKDFKTDIWSYYCTICDFDLCCECLGIHGKKKFVIPS